VDRRINAFPVLREGELMVESVSHFLHDCAKFSVQRRKLSGAVGSRYTALMDIMLQEKRMKALAVYVITTKRFDKEG
jgi:hypothetical protein